MYILWNNYCISLNQYAVIVKNSSKFSSQVQLPCAVQVAIFSIFDFFIIFISHSILCNVETILYSVVKKNIKKWSHSLINQTRWHRRHKLRNIDIEGTNWETYVYYKLAIFVEIKKIIIKLMPQMSFHPTCGPADSDITKFYSICLLKMSNILTSNNTSCNSCFLSINMACSFKNVHKKRLRFCINFCSSSVPFWYASLRFVCRGKTWNIQHCICFS